MTDRATFWVKVASAAIALLLLLSYNFVHTGGLLASYVDPAVFGYLAALGIEIAVVALASQIGRQKADGQSTVFFYFVLGSVVIVSALANASEGYRQRFGGDVTWQSVGGIDVAQLVIGIASTSLLSLITMAMAEIVGQYVQSPTATPGDVRETSSEIAETAQPEKATIYIWRAIYPQLNGDRREMTADDVARHIQARGLALPSPRTLDNWAQEARESEGK